MNYLDVYDAEKKAWENATKYPCSDLDRHSFRVGFEKCAEWLSCLGWKPASEFPPVDKETGLSDEVIAIQDRFCDGERVIYTRIVGSGWKHPNIKLWIEQPKEG